MAKPSRVCVTLSGLPGTPGHCGPMLPGRRENDLAAQGRCVIEQQGQQQQRCPALSGREASLDSINCRMLLGLADTGSSLHGYTVPRLTVSLKWYYCSGIMVIRDSSRRKTRPLMIESLPPHSLQCDRAARPTDTHPLLAGRSHAPWQGSQARQLGASSRPRSWEKWEQAGDRPFPRFYFRSR